MIFSSEMMRLVLTAREKIDAPKKSRKRILVVDDEPDIVFTLKNVLESISFEVVTSTDVDFALKKFKPGYFDLTILDIKMPKMNGFELYVKLKAIDEEMKAIFLSALSDLQNYSVLKDDVYPKWGERHFVKKPIENNELIEEVDLVLSL
jgi:DNA-binding response OmpR family regulator